MLEDSKRICNKLRVLDDDNSRLRQARLSDSEAISWAQNTNTFIRQCQTQRTRIYKLMKKPSIDHPKVLLPLAKIIAIIMARIQLIQDAAVKNTRDHSPSTKESCKDLINDLITMHENFEVIQSQLITPESPSITNNSIISIISESDCNSILEFGQPDKLSGDATIRIIPEQVPDQIEEKKGTPKQVIACSYEGLLNLKNQRKEQQQCKQLLLEYETKIDQNLATICELLKRSTTTREIEFYEAQQEQFNERKKVCHEKIDEIESTIADFDRCTALVTEKLEHHEPSRNAKKLQALYRGHRGRMEAKKKLMVYNEQNLWLNNAALRIQCMTRMRQARAVRKWLCKEQMTAVCNDDEHYIVRTMLVIAPMHDSPEGHCYALFPEIANDVQLSDVPVVDDVKMTHMSMDTRGFSDPDMEMRTASLIQAAYRGHRGRVKMKAAEVETVSRLQQRVQELEEASISYENRLSFLSKAVADAEAANAELHLKLMTLEFKEQPRDLAQAVAVESGIFEQLERRLSKKKHKKKRYKEAMASRLKVLKTNAESIREQYGAEVDCESGAGGSIDETLLPVVSDNYKHIRKKKVNKMLECERQLTVVQSA